MRDKRGALARTPWRRLTTRPVYENRWIRVREDEVELPDGRTTIYGVVEPGPCVGILPFLDPDTVVLVGQYRYVAGDFYWEMPTGALRPGESAEAGAQRELAEEAGYRAERLQPAPRPPDPTEFIEVRTFAFEEVVRMVERDEIKDGMTIVAVLHAARRRAR